ncbi:MAG TPA: hypothetical protein VF573_08430 [Paraburkholderia sp.]
MTDYIRANLGADLAISELAAQAGLSSFRFVHVAPACSAAQPVKRRISM